MEQKEVRRCKVSKKKYVNVIMALLATMIVPVYLYGVQVLYIALTAVITAVVVDFLCLRIAREKIWRKHDFSFIVTALISAMFFPATVPLWIVVISISISIVIAKYPFGGQGYNIFNPSAVGIAFVAICWPEYVLRYPIPQTLKAVTDSSLVSYGASPASVLQVGGTPKIGFIDVFLGNFAGPIGTTCMLVLAACLLYLVLRKTVSLRIFLSALLVVGLVAILFPRLVTGRWSSLLYEGCSGGLIFGLIFMAGDPVTVPKTKSGQILFGLILGSIVMLFRHFGTVELDFVFAILIANIFAIPCDSYAHYIRKKLDKFFPDDKFGKNKKTNDLTIGEKKDKQKLVEVVEIVDEKDEEKDENITINF
ncbi:MAG: RnfABCDGE type electron transport complex subunit D [Oscillospiraceae bacterium]